MSRRRREFVYANGVTGQDILAAVAALALGTVIVFLGIAAALGA